MAGTEYRFWVAVVILWTAFWCARFVAGQISGGMRNAYTSYGPYKCPPLVNYPSQCRLMVQCSIWWVELVKSPQSVCTRQDSPYWKACCPGVIGGFNKIGTMEEKSLDTELQEVPPGEIQIVATYGVAEIARLSAIEANLIEHKTFLTTSFPSWGYFINMRPSDSAVITGELGLMVTRATQKLREVMKLSNEAAGIATQKLLVKGTALENTCVPDPTCQISKYRTYDGSCNNLKTPSMGKSITQLGRYLAPKYDDGVWEGRDKGMPNSRLVRVLVGPDQDRWHKEATLMLMQYGQFLDHDITHVPVFQLANNTGISCCTIDGKHLPKELRHPHCFTLDILPEDPFYAPLGVHCVNFIRSMVAPRSDCNFGYAEQLNQVTHWHDASVIYGSTKEQADMLRENRGGRLKVFKYQNRDLLPLDWQNKDCIGYDKGLRCFLAGDSRVNQQVALTALQVVFLREHNSIAQELLRLNPKWDDEKLFQEARRILTAVLQHITHNEYLSVLLGRPTMELYGLLPRTSGYFLAYDEKKSGNIFNEFATAAYRYGHSMVNHWFELVDDNGATYDRLRLRDWFNNPHLLLKNDVLDGVLRGLVTTNPLSSDDFFTSELTNYLFKRPEQNHGGDLIAFNIWRGRDHGLPGYNFYRELVGLPKAKSFQDLLDLISPEIVEKFSRLYKSPDEVDFYIAGISERPVAGGLLGPTFAKIVADQFARLKEADRFYYELGGQISSFTPEQLDAIRQVSLGSILCRSADSIKYIQPLVFRPVSDVNPRVPCSAIPVLNLTPWKE